MISKKKLKAALNPMNWFYTIQGYFRTWFSGKPKNLTVEEKAELCPECWWSGECVECECPIVEMFNSDKPCPKGRF